MAAFALALAVLVDVLGDPPNRFHPVAAMGSFIRWTSGHAPARGPLIQFMYGTGLTLFGIFLFAFPLVALKSALRPHFWWAVIVDALLLKSVLSLRRLLDAGRQAEQALEEGHLPEAREAVSYHMVSRDTRTLGQGHVASAAVESLAENLSDSFVAPILAYVIGGLPLAWAYRFVNTADAMIGYRDERCEYLGKFAARLDDVLNWIPARLSALLIVIAAPMVRGNMKDAWRTMISQHDRTDSPNAGWPMSAAAGALGVTLEKIAHYRLEGGTSLPPVSAIRRARSLVKWAGLLGVLVVFLYYGT